jgi:hypothetical protein
MFLDMSGIDPEKFLSEFTAQQGAYGHTTQQLLGLAAAHFAAGEVGGLLNVTQIDHNAFKREIDPSWSKEPPGSEIYKLYKKMMNIVEEPRIGEANTEYNPTLGSVYSKMERKENVVQLSRRLSRGPED